MNSLQTRLRDALQPWRDASGWCVALSGGLDSTVLLHLLANWSRQEPLPPLRAVHIHHGLQAAAEAWPAHCQAVCAALGVPLQVLAVQVEAGASIEQAARRARYSAFANNLAEGELLLTGQHADDQAETLLFRLLRGAGVQGLAAMPACRALGGGHVLRPLLGCSRAELQAYAQAHGLAWVEDPSNADIHFARNFLRQRVMPLLAERWPRAQASMARSAEHLREATQLLAELAELDLEAAVMEAPEYAWLGVPNLPLGPLAALSEARQRNVLRYWLRPLTRMPDTEHWAGWQALRDAAVDAAPVWVVGQGQLRRGDARIWWLAGEWLRVPDALPITVPGQAWLALPANGRVRIEGQLPAGQWRLTYRVGGEQMLLPGRGHRDLKRMLNERRVPAFVRGRLPLLWRDGQLVALANLPGLDGPTDGAWRLIWQPPSSDQGLSC